MLTEYLCPLTPLGVSVADNTCHVFSELCSDQTPQYSPLERGVRVQCLEALNIYSLSSTSL